jgi:hypothetical protein
MNHMRKDLRMGLVSAEGLAPIQIGINSGVQLIEEVRIVWTSSVRGVVSSGSCMSSNMAIVVVSVIPTRCISNSTRTVEIAANPEKQLETWLNCANFKLDHFYLGSSLLTISEE